MLCSSAATQAADMLGQHGRAMRDYCLAQHISTSSILPVLLRARLHSRLEKMEKVQPNTEKSVLTIFSMNFVAALDVLDKLHWRRVKT